MLYVHLGGMGLDRSVRRDVENNDSGVVTVGPYNGSRTIRRLHASHENLGEWVS